jgi:hypothetical protein
MERKDIGSVLDKGIHNIFKGVCWTCGVPLQRTVTDSSAEQIAKLQTAGKVTLLNTFEAKLYAERQSEQTFFTADVYLWQLSNAFIVSETAYPFTPTGKLFSVSQDVANSKGKIIRRPIPFLARHIDFPLFHFSGANHENRAHFRAQFLPRLMVCLPFLKSRPDVKILLAPGHKRWQLQYFELFGIPPDRLIEGSYGTWRVKRLYYAPFLYSSHVLCAPEYYKRIRDLVAPAREGDKVVFISRADAPDRRILNEDAVFDLVKTIWPAAQRVIMGQMSLREQADLFGRACVIIGGHGAGLSAVLFSSQALLLQITPFGTNDNMGWALAFNQLASAVGSRAVRLDAHPSWQRKDYLCDLDGLRTELLRVVNVAGR